MRRQLAVLVAATTSLVLIAFLVPLGYLIAQVAADQAISAATREAEGVAPIVATVDRDVLALTLEQLSHDDAQDFPLTVFLGDGTVLGEPATRTGAVDLAATGRSTVADTAGGKEILVAVQGAAGGSAVIRSFVADDALHRGVGRAWLILGALGLALLGVGVLVADRLAVSFVRPLRELGAVSARLGDGDLTARVEPAGPKELTAVGRAVNALAARIRELLTTERESVADLSHRLRTPLTVLRLDAEALPPGPAAEQVQADVEVLARSVDDLIHEIRRPLRDELEPACDAAAVVVERAAFWAVLAEEEDRPVTTHMPLGPVPVRMSAADLTTVIDALLGNVFAHTPSGTGFTVRLEGPPQPGDDGGDGGSDVSGARVSIGAAGRSGSGSGGPGSGHRAAADAHVARLTVTDDGPGFGPTDPFDRGHSGGASTGLGLDIVRRTATAAGGDARVGEGAGAVVLVLLPVTDTAGG